MEDQIASGPSIGALGNTRLALILWHFPYTDLSQLQSPHKGDGEEVGS